MDILCNTVDSVKIQKVQSVSRTKKKPKRTLISSRWRLSILRWNIWVCSGFSCLFFYFVSGQAHSSACTPCWSSNAYCICWGNNYIGLDSQKETCFALGSFCWRLALELPLMLGSALCLLWKLLHGSVRESWNKNPRIFCILVACTLPYSRMEERGSLPAPQTTFCFYPVTV